MSQPSSPSEQEQLDESKERGDVTPAADTTPSVDIYTYHEKYAGRLVLDPEWALSLKSSRMASHSQL
jgi:hypothetical protein